MNIDPFSSDIQSNLLPSESPDVFKTQNIHIALRQVIDQLKLNSDTAEAFIANVIPNGLDELNKQIHLLRTSLKLSSKTEFNLEQFQDKYPIITYLLIERYYKHKKQQYINPLIGQIDFNELFSHINLSQVSHMSLNDIIQVKSLAPNGLSMQPIKVTPDSSIIVNFHNAIVDRHLPISAELTTREATLKYLNDHPKHDQPQKPVEPIQPQPIMISKTNFMTMVDEIEAIYTIISRRETWLTHINTIRNTAIKSFIEYGQKLKTYDSLMKVKTNAEKWIESYDQLLKTIQTDENGNHQPIQNQSTLIQSLSQKYQDDQIYLANLIKSLDIDSVKNQMTLATKIFQLHYQMVDDLSHSFPKPNTCNICLINPIDQFIDTCGHVICSSCSETIINKSVVPTTNMWDNHDNSNKKGKCPYCNLEFTKVNLRKIFF